MDKNFSSDIFKKIIYQMAEGVLCLDENDIIRICNPSAERIRNVSASRILGQSIYTIHPPSMHHRIRDLLSGLKEGLFSSSKRLVAVGNRYFDNSYAAVRDLSGAYVGTLLISRDVTENKRLSNENLHLKRSLSGSPEGGFVAQSDAMKRVLEMIDSVAPINSTVLVTGENGTGKELIVEKIHHQSPRSSAPLVRVNCAALPESLIESELFGHVRGSFTGAVEDRKGKFELADGGTIFLDEIGEIPLTSQAKLLRVLQERVIQPVGGRREIRIDVRIVAATNRNLSAEVKRGHFREDLFYRLNVINLHIPPLRDRRTDVIPLAEMFVDQLAHQMKRKRPQISSELRSLLLTHPFPGNVRQLKHALERALVLSGRGVLTPADLPPEMLTEGNDSYPPLTGIIENLKDAVTDFERQHISRVLDACSGRRNLAAETLGISRKCLWEKMSRHNMLPNGDTTQP